MSRDEPMRDDGGAVAPMSETQHLLLCLAEECDEVGQRIMKTLRFGLDEVQPGQPLTNAGRITEELHDLISVAIILQQRDVLPTVMPSAETVLAKLGKIERFMAISIRQGTLATRTQDGADHDA